MAERGSDGRWRGGLVLVPHLATLPEGMKWVVRLAFPAAAILTPAAFFLSVLSLEATEPNVLINLAYVGGVVLAAGLLVLGVGLIRRCGIPNEG